MSERLQSTSDGQLERRTNVLFSRMAFACAAFATGGLACLPGGSTDLGEEVVPSLSVTADLYRILPTAGRPLGTDSVTVHATMRGGNAPFVYRWTVTDPFGESANSLLSSVYASDPIFTGGTIAGAYRLTCSAMDSTFRMWTESILIYVSQELGLDVIADRAWVMAGGGTKGTSTLTALPVGGSPPYVFNWIVVAPDGSEGNSRLADASANPQTFTSAAMVGTYTVTCHIADSTGAQVADSVMIQVGQVLDVSIGTNRQRVSAGGGEAGTAALTATVVGGASPYSYLWSVLDPNGVRAVMRLDDTAKATPVFTSADTPGTYQIGCVVSDAAGHIALDSLEVIVGQQLVGSVGVTSPRTGVDGGLSSSNAWVASGGGEFGRATITAEVLGGSPPYTYEWSCFAPDGTAAADRLSGSSNAARVFTSALTLGTYRVVCRMTDATGYVFTDSVNIVVYDVLTLSTTIDRQQMPAGGAPYGVGQFTASVIGGTPPFTYAWSIIGPDGLTDNTRLDSITSATPVFTSASLNGIYRANCIVTDSVGQQDEAVILFIVGQPVAVYLTTEQADVLAGGGQTQLHANVTGGTTPYQYLWTVTSPSGATENARLDSTTIADPTFTSTLQIGTYNLACVVTDVSGFTAVESISIVVGGGLDQGLSVDVTANRVSLPATGEQATLSARVSGGVPVISYSWNVLNPSGADVTGAVLSSSTVAGPVFTAPATAGTYRVQCTVTDSVLKTFTDSLLLYVGMPLSVDVTTSKASLPSAQTATLSATVTGGVSVFTYAWTVLDPSGGNANASLSGTAVAAPTFTAPATAGTYRASCTVTDAAGAMSVDSLVVYVGMPLSVDVTTSKASLPSAQTATLSAAVTGGVSAFTYAWTVLDPSGGNANASLSSTAVAAPTFTAPATAGTYRASCTVTDAAGTTFTDSLEVYVGMPLTAYVRTNKLSIPATGGQATLSATANGGVSPYIYSWSALDPSNGNANAALSGTAVAAPTFTAPATAGTYRLVCTITDAAGNTAIDSLELAVGMGLSLAVTSTKISLPSAQTASLTATVMGGISAYTYAWVVLSPSGGNVTGATLSSAVSATPTFTAPATAGTYRASCTVTDSAGATFTDSVAVYVGMPLSVDVTTTKASLPSVQTATLTAAVTGGVSAFTYAWTVLDPSGGNANASLSSTTVASSTFTAPATAGTYRASCTVTDSAGATFTDSVAVYVGMPLSVDVTSTKQTLFSSDTAAFNASVRGGVSPYSYSWTVQNADSTDVSATVLSNTAVQSPTFTAPAAGGTYRATCTVTDSAASTVAGSVHLYVATRSLTLTTPAAEDSDADPSSVLGVTTLGSLSTILQVNNTLTHPRNLKVRCGDPGNSLAGDVWIEVQGVSAQGFPQTEYFYFLIPGGGGYVTTEGVKPFSRVDTVRYVILTGSASGNETVRIGVGNIFGLPKILDTVASVRQVKLLPNTVLTGGVDYSIIVTPGRQGVRFINAASDPDGANSYEVLFDDN